MIVPPQLALNAKQQRGMDRVAADGRIIGWPDDNLTQNVKDIAWKAQLRLHQRYRRLLGRGKKSQVAITAVARELVGFMWCIAQQTDTHPTSAAA